MAKGSRSHESDYDVLVLTEEATGAQEEEAIRDGVYSLELAHEVLVSLFFFTRSRWDEPVVRGSPFYQEVMRYAIEI